MLPGLVAAIALGPLACERQADDAGAVESPGPWTITVYYTAVESYHLGPPLTVRGCSRRDCVFGDDFLGTFPAGFVQTVREEGTGRVTSGPRRGSVLNWSHDTGFWVDHVPVDTAGRALVPFRTAAADAATLPAGTTFVVDDCGREADGSRIDPAACAALRRGTWEVRAAFTPGLGGRGHLDLYIGEEDRVGFTDHSTLYLTGVGARIGITGRSAR